MQDRARGRPEGAPAYWDGFDSLTSELAVRISLLELQDGSRAHVYQAGPDGVPDVLIVSPAESPFLLISRLFRRLSRKYRVTAWDPADGAFMDSAPEAPPPTLSRMANALLGISEAYQLSSPHLVSWCSGALVAAWVLAGAPGRAGSATFIAPPSVLGRCAERTEFQSHFLQTILKLASGGYRDEEAVFRDIQSAPRGRPFGNADDEAIFELTNLPVRDLHALRRYARSIHNACTCVPPSMARFRALAYAEVVEAACQTLPIALLHCKDDDVVSYKCSADVAARNADVKLVLYPSGGHFVIFKQPDMLGTDIEGFVDGLRCPSRGAEPREAVEAAHGAQI